MAKTKETADKKKSKETEEVISEAPPVAAPPEKVAPRVLTKSTKIAKLQPKNKSRLPRRQKKALQKAAARG